MPSRRALALNPRAPAVPPPQPPRSSLAEPVRVEAPTAVQPAAAPANPAEEAARAGGFHESSYELQHGLQVSESEWPDDVTVPGALGDR